MIENVQSTIRHQVARSLFWALVALPIALFLLREHLPDGSPSDVIPGSAAVGLIGSVYLWASPALLLIGIGLYSRDANRVRLFLQCGLFYAAAVTAWMAWQLLQSTGEIG
jgi:hypothetical protein